MITNADIKRIRSLTQKKFRRQYSQFIVEGKRLVIAALESHAPLQEVYLTQSFVDRLDHQDLIHELNNQFIPFLVLPDITLKKLSKTISPAGILGICSIPEISAPDPLQPSNWLYLDHINDPGNLGTLLRTASWFNVTNVALSANCSDPYNPKVVRGGMGAHFNLSIFINTHLKSLTQGPHTILGTDQKGKPLPKLKIRIDQPWIIVLGNEAHGISDSHRKLLDSTISIPRLGSGESLNVAVAGGILIHQLLHQ